MGSIRLRTVRLQLGSATPELAAAGLNAPSDFSRRLEAAVPQHWSPPLHDDNTHDDNTKEFTLNCLKESPDAGWGTWYFLLSGRAEERTRAIGIGGSKGEPSDCQRLGFASE